MRRLRPSTVTEGRSRPQKSLHGRMWLNVAPLRGVALCEQANQRLADEPRSSLAGGVEQV